MSDFVSLFAGVGGFDLAFERAGWRCIGQVEKDKHCQTVLKRHYPDVPRWEDIHDVKGSDLGAQALLVGGFPCQDYSVVGLRGGLAGDRGALWWQFHRLIAECRPLWVVGENVPGLLSSNDGRDFRTIIDSLVELGYGVCWRILDAQWFGVAQRRRRVFIVGHSGSFPRPEVLFEPEGLSGGHPPSREAGSRVAALTAHGLGGGGPDDNLAQGGQLISTLTASGPVRRLTPLECERLQGFPDDWSAGQSDTQRYRQMGNAVCVPVAEWIGRRLAEAT